MEKVPTFNYRSLGLIQKLDEQTPMIRIDNLTFCLVQALCFSDCKISELLF